MLSVGCTLKRGIIKHLHCRTTDICPAIPLKWLYDALAWHKLRFCHSFEVRNIVIIVKSSRFAINDRKTPFFTFFSIKVFKYKIIGAKVALCCH